MNLKMTILKEIISTKRGKEKNNPPMETIDNPPKNTNPDKISNIVQRQWNKEVNHPKKIFDKRFKEAEKYVKANPYPSIQKRGRFAITLN